MKKSTACLSAATLFTLAAWVDAAVVSVDVQGTTYSGPGILDTTSHVWLSKPTSGNTFSLDTQTVGIIYGGFSSGNIDATIDLFDDYKHNNAGSAIGFVLTGLDMTKTYDIVLYGAQNFGSGRGASFDLVEGTYSGADPQITTGDQQSSFVEGVNYVRFNGIAPTNSSGDQRIRFLVGNGPDGIGFFNGFEIQSVPEPAASLLGGLGMLALLRRRR